MESLRRHRSPGSNRFLAVFFPSLPSHEAAGAAVELHESDVLWTSTAEGPDSAPSPPSASPSADALLSPSSRVALRRPPDRAFGILAALPEDDASGSPSPFVAVGPHLIRRKPSISSASSSASNSPSSASAAAARMIPSIQKPKPSGRAQQAHSLPVNVPVIPRRSRRFETEENGGVGDGNVDDHEMLPPHEIVAMSNGWGSPKTTFSVLEGAGRTLKGRDLWSVRDAVFRQTGFLD